VLQSRWKPNLPSELPPTEKFVEDALPFANLKIDVHPKGDGTNYQTEIMVEIEKRLTESLRIRERIRLESI
jgi:hypothetical protein